MKPLLFISSVDQYLLTQGLNAVAKQYAKATSWNLIMAGSIISVLPILFLFIVLNKYFITLNDQSSGSK
jgi:multiple sugar transport system permease protein